MTYFSEEILAEHVQNMVRKGFSILPGVLDDTSCDRLQSRLGRALMDYQPRDSGQSMLDRYLLHDLLCQDQIFSALLEDPRLQQAVAPFLGEFWVMYAFTSSSLPPGSGNYGSRIHVDSPRFIPGYNSNIGVIWTLSEFTSDNGATRLLPASHLHGETPSEDYFESNCVEALCPRGSLIVFNARTFHRAGVNTSSGWRHALTMNACRSYMKQRFDWVRFIPPAITDTLNAQARRIVGFDTRLPVSLDEFFVPEDRRLYKASQG